MFKGVEWNPLSGISPYQAKSLQSYCCVVDALLFILVTLNILASVLEDAFSNKGII